METPRARPIAVDDVEAAAGRIGIHVHRTPVLTSRGLDGIAGAELYLKAENLQKTGSFKARGAFNALLGAERAEAVVTVSSGNHAQALAHACRALGVRCVCVMPEGSVPVKLAATREYGAEIVTDGVTADNREEVVRELAAGRGLAIVHPYEDPLVMAGQGTLALELLADAPELDAVVAPVGGGGLVAGVATAVKARSPHTRVVGVEPEGADDGRRSLEEGRRILLERAPDTVCDGVRARGVGMGPWTVVRELVDEIVAVADTDTLWAMELLWTRTKTVVEPSGALAAAAVLTRRVGGGRIGVVVSGGNVDPARLPQRSPNQRA